MKKSMVSLLLFILVGPCYADLDLINKDQEEKITISSDTADLNRSTGVGVYRVDVHIDQGSTHIQGEVVTTYADDNNKLEKAIVEAAEGTLAHYETLVEEGKPVMHAKAKIIKFYPQRNFIELIGEASISQGTDFISGDKLDYDIDKQRLIANNQHADGHAGRTTIVIQPKSKGNGGSFINPNSNKA